MERSSRLQNSSTTWSLSSSFSSHSSHSSIGVELVEKQASFPADYLEREESSHAAPAPPSILVEEVSVELTKTHNGEYFPPSAVEKLAPVQRTNINDEDVSSTSTPKSVGSTSTLPPPSNALHESFLNEEPQFPVKLALRTENSKVGVHFHRPTVSIRDCPSTVLPTLRPVSTGTRRSPPDSPKCTSAVKEKSASPLPPRKDGDKSPEKIDYHLLQQSTTAIPSNLVEKGTSNFVARRCPSKDLEAEPPKTVFATGGLPKFLSDDFVEGSVCRKITEELSSRRGSISSQSSVSPPRSEASRLLRTPKLQPSPNSSPIDQRLQHVSYGLRTPRGSESPIGVGLEKFTLFPEGESFGRRTERTDGISEQKSALALDFSDDAAINQFLERHYVKRQLEFKAISRVELASDEVQSFDERLSVNQDDQGTPAVQPDLLKVSTATQTEEISCGDVLPVAGVQRSDPALSVEDIFSEWRGGMGRHSNILATLAAFDGAIFQNSLQLEHLTEFQVKPLGHQGQRRKRLISPGNAADEPPSIVGSEYTSTEASICDLPSGAVDRGPPVRSLQSDKHGKRGVVAVGRQNEDYCGDYLSYVLLQGRDDSLMQVFYVDADTTDINIADDNTFRNDSELLLRSRRKLLPPPFHEDLEDREKNTFESRAFPHLVDTPAASKNAVATTPLTRSNANEAHFFTSTAKDACQNGQAPPTDFSTYSSISPQNGCPGSATEYLSPSAIFSRALRRKTVDAKCTHKCVAANEAFKLSLQEDLKRQGHDGIAQFSETPRLQVQNELRAPRGGDSFYCSASRSHSSLASPHEETSQHKHGSAVRGRLFLESPKQTVERSTSPIRYLMRWF